MIKVACGPFNCDMGQSCCVRVQPVEKFGEVEDADKLTAIGAHPNGKELTDGMLDERAIKEEIVQHPGSHPHAPPSDVLQTNKTKPSPKAAAFPSPPLSKSPGDEMNNDVPASRSYFDQDIPELETLASDPESMRARMDRPYVFMTGAKYTGQWKANARHGFGTQEWPNGARYEGEWVENQAEGRGKSTHADGSVFIGQWRNGKAHGIGVYYQKEPSSIFEGEWVDDLQHGHGTERWNNGAESRYEGQYNQGKIEGFGTYRWADGSVYEGDWRANIIHGNGFFAGKDGRQFRGQWYNNSIHGIGQSSLPDGATYAGQYMYNKKHGFGVLTKVDGEQAEGFWEEGCEVLE